MPGRADDVVVQEERNWDETIREAISKELEAERARSRKLLDDKLALAGNIEETMNLQGIVKKILAYPEQIAHKQDELRNTKNVLEQEKAELLFIEQMLMVEITEEQNPTTGKAMFTNDTARKAELAKRIKESKEYQSLLKNHKTLENAAQTVQFDLDRLTNEFSTMKIVAELTTARLNLLAGL